MRRLIHQTAHEFHRSMRRPAALALELLAPAGLLALLVAASGAQGPQGALLTANLAALAMALSAYLGGAVSAAARREHGLLRSYAGTPLTPGLFVLARLLATALVAMLSALAVVAAGVLGFGAPLVRVGLADAAAGLVLGALGFSALGLAVAALAQRTETAHAVALWTLIAIAAITWGARAATPLTPHWLGAVAGLLPLEPVISLISAAFGPAAPAASAVLPGMPQSLVPLAVIVLWGLAGGAVALSAFDWRRSRP